MNNDEKAEESKREYEVDILLDKIDKLQAKLKIYGDAIRKEMKRCWTEQTILKQALDKVKEM